MGTWRWACEEPTGFVDERGVDLREDMRSMWLLRFHRKTTQSLYGDDEVGEKVRENVSGSDSKGLNEDGESELYGANRNWDAPLDVSLLKSLVCCLCLWFAVSVSVSVSVSVPVSVSVSVSISVFGFVSV